VKQAFVQSIGVNSEAAELKIVEVKDPVQYVICADAGVDQNSTSSPAMLAYPELCCVECAGATTPTGGWVDWSCVDTYCYEPTASCAYLHAPSNFFTDEDVQKAATRHLGGSNIGFLDGHATWMNAKAIIAAEADGDLDGIFYWCVNSEIYAQMCGDPTGMDFLR
jgi:prepilin-type processing-associated H-X9-DG protein